MDIEEGNELLSVEEVEALLPLKERWEKELASLEQELKPLIERKLALTRKLAAFKGILPPDEAHTQAIVQPTQAAEPQPPPAVFGGRPKSGWTARRKKFTPVEAYWLPTLLALVECGGRARRDEIVELVGKKMQSVLTPDDQELLPSGVEVRWKNRVAWQRENMKRRGLMRDDSPQGIWEITDAGRKWLQDALGRFSFYRLAALRVGNLLRGHALKMGDYRNFVRQFAQEFDDPSLGEADDNALTEPIVLLWKEGCLRLKKYDPMKKEWWNFAELQDISALVGRSDWSMDLTEEGRAALEKMEGHAKLMNKKKADFEPVAIRGENLSATVLRDRR